MKFESVYDFVYIKKEDREIDGKEFIYAHRIQMSLKLGRKILPSECVHHVDGNKKNNLFDNLFLFHTKGDHVRFHNSLKNGITPELTMLDDGSYVCKDILNLKSCQYCGKSIFRNKNRCCVECYIELGLNRHKEGIPSYRILEEEILKGVSALKLAVKYNTSYQTIRKHIRDKVV